MIFQSFSQLLQNNPSQHYSPESWTSQKGPCTSFYCFLGSLAAIFGTEEAQGARFRRARSPAARARWGRSKRRSRATLGCLSATEGGRRRAAHRSSARRRSATACGGAPVSGWRRGGHGRIQQGWGSGGARRRGTEARAHGLRRAAACRRRHGSGTSAETRGTRKNEESTSISASPSFDLSRWTKKMVAVRWSSTSRWGSMAMDGRWPEDPRFPAIRRSELSSKGLGRELGR